MRATKKEVKDICLPIYKKLLKMGKKDNLVVFKSRLRKYKAELGICKLLLWSTDKNWGSLFYRKGIYFSNGTRNNSFGGYIWKVPYAATTKKEAVECIKKRIELLESW